MYIYTLAFLKRGNEILLLNREKKPWKGSWNGVGGKRNQDESPLQCIIREIQEETSICVTESQVEDKGILTWTSFDALGVGLHLFLVHLDSHFSFITPVKTEEGILDWKAIDWINDFDNEGVAKNIPYFLPVLLQSNQRFHFHCTFEHKVLKQVEQYPLMEPML